MGYYPSQDFDFDLFKGIIDEVSTQTELVVPWGGGEPSLNPDMIHYCKGAGVYAVVSTKATLLNERRM